PDPGVSKRASTLPVRSMMLIEGRCSLTYATCCLLNQMSVGFLMSRHCETNLPSAVKTWTRLFSRSQTYTVPSGPTQRLCGRWNSPGASLPGLPQEEIRLPSFEKRCTRLLRYPSDT